MRLTTLAEPLLEFGTGTHICPRTGIEHLGVYDQRDELRRTELRIGVVGRGDGIDLLDEWLEKCRNPIERTGQGACVPAIHCSASRAAWRLSSGTCFWASLPFPLSETGIFR